jgi:hypothetical protein
VDVPGLEISPNTIVYYYTYGSVLAALSRPRDNKCGEAMKVLSDVRAEINRNPDGYIEARDTILKDIVQPSEFICQSLGEDSTPVSSVPGEATPTLGVGDVMSDITATPTP